MPTYNFVDGDGVFTTEFMWVSELDEYVEAHPELTLIPPSAAAQLDPWRMGRRKPDDTFREMLGAIKRKYSGSTIET